MNDTLNYDLIITIINRGFADQAMDAAKKSGARGGTILYARGTGEKEAQEFFGITVHPEKEVVLILSDHAHKNEIMRAIKREMGLESEGCGICFSVPVEEAIGISEWIGEPLK